MDLSNPNVVLGLGAVASVALVYFAPASVYSDKGLASTPPSDKVTMTGYALAAAVSLAASFIAANYIPDTTPMIAAAIGFGATWLGAQTASTKLNMDSSITVGISS